MTGVELLRQRKADGRKIVATTAYDFWSATVLNHAPVDFLLVGDSLAMVVYGEATTRAATVEMMVRHTEAVRRGAPDRMVVADLPWPPMEEGPEVAVAAGVALVEAGADAVKVEALPGHLRVVRGLRAREISVVGHLGLLPQAVPDATGFRVRGRGGEGEEMRAAARALQEAGCCALVLECIPAPLARAITADLDIPTVGIGAGPAPDGQILVLHDLAGFTPGRVPRFVRPFGDGADRLARWVEAYARAVREEAFPSTEESYS